MNMTVCIVRREPPDSDGGFHASGVRGVGHEFGEERDQRRVCDPDLGGVGDEQLRAKSLNSGRLAVGSGRDSRTAKSLATCSCSTGSSSAWAAARICAAALLRASSNNARAVLVLAVELEIKTGAVTAGSGRRPSER